MSKRVDLDGIEARANAATDRPYSHLSGGSAEQRSRDAEFIVGARDDVLALVAEVRALRAALGDVVGALGPDRICECPPSDGECGLREEAADALATARAALTEHGAAQ